MCVCVILSIEGELFFTICNKLFLDVEHFLNLPLSYMFLQRTGGKTRIPLFRRFFGGDPADIHNWVLPPRRFESVCRIELVKTSDRSCP